MPRTRRPLAADVVAADAQLRAGGREYAALRTLQPTADQVLPIRHALEPELLCDRLVVAVELYGTRPEIRSALGLDGQQAVAAVRRNTDDDRDGTAGGGNRDVCADPERGITARGTWNDGCGEEQRRGIRDVELEVSWVAFQHPVPRHSTFRACRPSQLLSVSRLSSTGSRMNPIRLAARVARQVPSFLRSRASRDVNPLCTDTCRTARSVPSRGRSAD